MPKSDPNQNQLKVIISWKPNLFILLASMYSGMHIAQILRKISEFFFSNDICNLLNQRLKLNCKKSTLRRGRALVHVISVYVNNY